MSRREIWLTRNDRFEWVRYDTATGRVVGRLRPAGRSAPTAGLLGTCLGKPVAFYVDADGTGYVLQSGSTAIPVDDQARIGFRRSARNHLAHLDVDRGPQRLHLTEWTYATAPDPPSDPVSSKDFLGTIHDFLTREERRRQGLSVWTQDADPARGPEGDD
ncbi:hypothetical protein IU433_19130 [Nocardia puris]|uniref:Uncharacterized protein n=1 Tax=Nocardia puris TaxID=208602 RepID=A0A366DFS9_9NOCA|nr:hypothetical protein [Nocardia puris]MBF6211557.1 hypothetical protein [Nocardia puris]MBF6366809.1 hypothetical protein [Nocardia puris]MBF6461150.1 hypothetical protein [Nocardia puris]RBO88923.1 hypothetical protein DFR74_108148 [Nocardia puris]